MTENTVAVRHINFQGERYDVPADMTAEQLLEMIAVDMNEYTMVTDEDTLFLMPKTGSKGADEDEDEDPAREALKTACGEGIKVLPLGNNIKEVRMKDGKLVPVVYHTAEEIYDKLEEIEAKLDALLAK
jgi:hypothetical protein